MQSINSRNLSIVVVSGDIMTEEEYKNGGAIHGPGSGN